jgi:hypothetical protein
MRNRRHRGRGYNSGGIDRPITMMITFILIGLMVSATLLIAGDRGIIVDTVATQLGVDIWEISYFIYIMFLVVAVIYDMITDRNGSFDISDLLGMMLVVIMSVISFIGLQTIAVGNISIAVALMITENNGWWLFYSLIIAVFIANKMMVKFH